MYWAAIYRYSVEWYVIPWTGFVRVVNSNPQSNAFQGTKCAVSIALIRVTNNNGVDSCMAV